MIRRKGIGIVIAGLVMGFAALPLAAFAAANTAGLKSFSAQGEAPGRSPPATVAHRRLRALLRTRAIV